MSAKDTGGAAFPLNSFVVDDISGQGRHENMTVEPILHHPGMTLRDWLAGQALCAMGGKSAELVMASIPSLAKATGRDEAWRGQMIEGVAKSAYDIADAMIEARNK